MTCCEHCGATLEIKKTFGRGSHMGRRRRFCDDHCRHAAAAAREAAHRRAHPRCAYCGRPIAEGAVRYCNERCERLALRGVRVGNSGDIPAAEIEKRFARAKARLRYERVVQQAEAT